MKHKLVMLNGPSGAGKDTFAMYLADELMYYGLSVKQALFKEHLFRILAVSSATDERELRKRARSTTEKYDDSLSGIYGSSIVNALIYWSKCLYKSGLNNRKIDAFTKRMIKKPTDATIVPDLRYSEEAYDLLQSMEQLGIQSDIYMISIRRKGTAFGEREDGRHDIGEWAIIENGTCGYNLQRYFVDNTPGDLSDLIDETKTLAGRILHDDDE